ncbi:MAG TPA: hypothetical protein VGK73_03445 [Polyangiaceae bacterium]
MKLRIDQHERHDDVERLMHSELKPRTLQSNVRVRWEMANAMSYYVRLDGSVLVVIVEVELISSGEGAEERKSFWAHLSVSVARPERIPNWGELRWCKEYFLGDRKAIQVLPPRAEYVNIKDNVLHLYAPLAHDPLPDFRLQVSGEVGL